MHHGSSYLEHLNFLSAIRAKGEKAPAVDWQEGLISVAIELQPSFLLRRVNLLQVRKSWMNIS
jgi:hypothetical protein